eukprot:g2214.t1
MFTRLSRLSAEVFMDAGSIEIGTSPAPASWPPAVLAPPLEALQAQKRYKQQSQKRDKQPQGSGIRLLPSPGGEPDCFSFFDFLWAGSPSLLSLIETTWCRLLPCLGKEYATKPRLSGHVLPLLASLTIYTIPKEGYGDNVVCQK